MGPKNPEDPFNKFGKSRIWDQYIYIYIYQKAWNGNFGNMGSTCFKNMNGKSGIWD